VEGRGHGELRLRRRLFLGFAAAPRMAREPIARLGGPLVLRARLRLTRGKASLTGSKSEKATSTNRNRNDAGARNKAVGGSARDRPEPDDR
jgi:hypothetical protein